jgi:hypothetical protein
MSPHPYTPDGLPLNNLDHRLLLPLVGRANAALARYDGLLQSIPNPAVMLSPLTTQEAVLSSKIEGTQATVDEVLEQEAGLLKEGEKFQDIQEISNYRQALYSAREYLKDYTRGDTLAVYRSHSGCDLQQTDLPFFRFGRETESGIRDSRKNRAGLASADSGRGHSQRIAIWPGQTTGHAGFPQTNQLGRRSGGFLEWLRSLKQQ